MAGSNQDSGPILTGTGATLNDILSGLVNNLAVQAQSGDTQAQLVSRMAQLAGVSETQGDVVVENTKAVVANTLAQGSASGGTSKGSVLGTVASAFTSGLGLTSVVKGLVSLFGAGGESPAPVTLTQYVAPPSINYEGSLSRSPSAQERTTVLLPTLWSEESRETAKVAAVTPGAPTPERSEMPAVAQVTVQVQAMDSRSFLDHRDEIAQAVREAMLHSHALNDVVREL